VAAEPASPVTFQVSSSVTSERGTTMIRQVNGMPFGPGICSPSTYTRQPATTQSACVMPLPNGHCPVTVYPPGTRSARPTGRIKPAVTMSRCGNSRSATSSERNSA